MGRQHTIYLSDVTWEQLQSLKKENKTMSETVRNAIEICAQQSIKFNLVEYQLAVIETYKRKLDFYESKLCNKCKKELLR